jgi:hypothetical protein
MNVTSLLNIERFLTFPCYSYEKAGDDSYEVFKITRKDGKFKSQKYLIKSDACSCKGFHHRATCRHVQMLSGDYSAVMAMEKVIATPKDVVIKFLEEFLPEVNLPVDKVRLEEQINENTYGFDIQVEKKKSATQEKFVFFCTQGPFRFLVGITFYTKES